MPKFLSRRTMLRGMIGGSSVAIGLPLLDAMVNFNGTALADGGALPRRFMTYYWADGINIGEFEPAQVGAGWELSPLLAPLAPVKDYISVLTGLRNRSARTKTHHEGMTAFNGYTYIDTGGLNSNSGGPTIDQVIADAPGMADRTPIRAVHVRCSKDESTDGDGGTTYAALSHRDIGGNLVPQVPESSPQAVWEYLFGEFVPKPDDRELRTSILDFVKEDVDRLKPTLGHQDQQRLEAHLSGIAELENKIATEPPTCELPEVPTHTNDGTPEPNIQTNIVMAELIAYAFACDVTRVASFLFKKFVSSTSFGDNAPPISGIHHANSHGHPSNQAYLDGIEYQLARLSDVLQVFQNTPDLDGGNLLDSTIVYASTDCSTGASHSIRRQPIILAGHGRGYLVHPGIHYQATPWNGQHGGGGQHPSSAGNMSDVLLTCLQAFDPDASSIGDPEDPPYSDTPVTEVMA
jgi:hypothetical protein